ELGESAPESNARNSRRHFARGTAGFHGRGHLWIESFDLARSAVQKEKDDGLVFDQPFALGRRGPCVEQPGQCEPAQRQAARLQKRPATARTTSVMNAEHAASWQKVWHRR